MGFRVFLTKTACKEDSKLLPHFLTFAPIQPALHPVMLTKLFLYGYLNGLPGSRNLVVI